VRRSDTPTGDNPYRRTLLRRQRSRDTRARIVRAAARVWGQQGFDATTVDDICKAAGVARSTYYYHFQSTDQLLGELTWATASGTAADIDAVLAAGDIDQALATFIDGLARRMGAVPKELAALVLRRAIAGVESIGDFPGDRVDFGLILARILERGREAGRIRPDIDVKEVGAILGGMTMEALVRWATGHTGTIPLRDSLALRFELVLDGLRT